MEDFHPYQVFGAFLPLIVAIIGSIIYGLYNEIKYYIYIKNNKR